MRLPSRADTIVAPFRDLPDRLRDGTSRARLKIVSTRARRASQAEGPLAALGREPWIVLVPLVLAQWVALASFALSVPHNGWLFYQGGDQTFFYTDSWVLSHGHIPESKVGYAWSFLLMPLPLTLGSNFLSAVPAIVLLQTLVLAPIALLAIYGIGARLGGRMIGYVAAGLWVTVPFLSIPLFVDRYHEKFVDQFLPQALGLTGLGDYPSTVALLVSGYFLVRALDTHAPTESALAGLAAAFAVGIKPSNALFLAGPLLAFTVARRWREATAFVAAAAPCALALAIWKARGLGYLPILKPDTEALAAGYGGLVGTDSPPLAVVVSRYVQLDWDHLRANYLYLQEVFWSTRLVQWVPLAGFLAVARFSWSKALFLGGWLGAFVLVKGSSPEASLEQGTLLRLLMPALPAFVLLAAAIPLLVPQFGPRLARRFPCTTRALRPTAFPVVGALVLFGVVPLAVLTFLTPLRDGRAATLAQASVYVPAQADFGLRATPDPEGGVDLTWRARDVPAAHPFYTVYRAPVEFRIEKGSPDNFPLVREGLVCEPRTSGAHRCSIEMEQIATTRATTFHDSPSAGTWSYRVGLAANWVNDESLGDAFVVSKPASVRVR